MSTPAFPMSPPTFWPASPVFSSEHSSDVIAHSGLRLCYVYPFNTTASAPFFVKEADQILPPNFTPKLAKLLETLSVILVSDCELIALYFDNSATGRLFVSCNAEDDLDIVRKQMCNITEAIDEVTSRTGNLSNAFVYAWMARLGVKLSDHCAVKIAKRAQDIRSKFPEEVEKYHDLKQAVADGVRPSVNSVAARAFLSSKYSKQLNHKLRWKLAKLASYMTFPAYLVSMLEQPKYKAVLENMSANLVLTQSKQRTVKTLEFVETVKIYGEFEHISELADHYIDYVEKGEVLEEGRGYANNEIRSSILENVLEMNTRREYVVSVHAELHLLETLISKGVVKRNSRRKYPIFMSRLCCYLCYHYLEKFETWYGVKVIAGGTDGKFYSGWEFPEDPNGFESTQAFITSTIRKVLKDGGVLKKETENIDFGNHDFESLKEFVLEIISLENIESKEE
ncbi:hypothetical protein HK096_007187 [Nowakowskiella sp. JEL0078]|nr:hypothetical protein HK096_007187 [Nowakowskiella sp. JEL0078]